MPNNSDDSDAGADPDQPDDSGNGAGPSGGNSERDSQEARTTDAPEAGSEVAEDDVDVRRNRSDAHVEDDPDGDSPTDGPDETRNELLSSGAEQSALSGSTDSQPQVSVTIEGEYDTVLERLEHPGTERHNELDTIFTNVEETLLAVVRTGGGIRSDIYQATDFELEDPWEIRIYLEVLAIHDLVHLRDDQWVPSDHLEQTTSDRDSG